MENAMTLNELETAYKQCSKIATPHRELNFDYLRKIAKDDAIIKGTLVFIEEHNTGYAGHLERWIMVIPTKDEKTISVQIDLLPGQIKNASR